MGTHIYGRAGASTRSARKIERTPTCKDCKFYRPFNDSCDHPSVISWNPLTNRKVPRYCGFVRGEGEACGPDANLFEEGKRVGAWGWGGD